jgi:hypothetical protein
VVRRRRLIGFVRLLVFELTIEMDDMKIGDMILM